MEGNKGESSLLHQSPKILPEKQPVLSELHSISVQGKCKTSFSVVDCHGCFAWYAALGACSSSHLLGKTAVHNVNPEYALLEVGCTEECFSSFPC